MKHLRLLFASILLGGILVKYVAPIITETEGVIIVALALLVLPSVVEHFMPLERSR